MKDLITPQDPIAFSAAHFIKQASLAIAEKGSFWIALSGGSTPKKIYEQLAKEPLCDHVDWQAVHLFWSDERSVAPDHHDSNYHMAMTSGLQTLPIPPEQIHRMEAEKEDLYQSAFLYEEKIRAVTGNQGLDMIMLGMGDDGHTASLFPHTKALYEEERWVLPNYIENKKTWRLTFTYPCMAAARLSVVYILGQEKAQRLAQVLKAPSSSFEEIPIVKIGLGAQNSLWITDQRAANLLE